MKKNQMEGVLNWTSTKRNPYIKRVTNYKNTISKDTQWSVAKVPNYRAVLKTIFFNHNLHSLSGMDLKHTELLSGSDGNDLVTYFDDWYIDCSKPITVWLTYPFNANVKAIIYPLATTYIKSDITVMATHVGYYMWQIARLYAELYQNHAQSLDIWGHAFEDLFLEGIEIYNNNVVLLMIGS